MVKDNKPTPMPALPDALDFLADFVPYTTYFNRNTNLEIVPLAQQEHCWVNVLLPQFRAVVFLGKAKT